MLPGKIMKNFADSCYLRGSNTVLSSQFPKQAMAINGRTSSQTHVVVNCNLDSLVRHILPVFSIMSLVTSSSVRIYRSYSNDEITTLSFITFLCFAASLLCYCFELNQQIPPWKKSPKKHNFLIGIWLLMNVLMVQFCFRFAKLTRSSASMSFFFVLLGGNMLVIHLYSIWGDYNLRNRSGKFSRAISVRVNERTDEMERGESEFV
ncbi:hypothetical protein QN277_012574 [Acacia crassicarpa]|uniref:Uncharacterized protein n=1 Tax=Acacia crassicarpa TaxID=499986 RepID=A0AAE1N120_9FABA|nr:hypothetical protein QN277_012574 [Acacia crassicarpa]